MHGAAELPAIFWRRKKRVVAAWFVLTAAVIFGVGAWLHVPEPVHNGMALGEFLDATAASRNFHQDGEEAMTALGPKAVRYLVKVLENEPTRPQEVWAALYPKAPEWVKSNVPPPRNNYNTRRARAAAMLGWSPDSNAVSAVPLLCRLAKEDAFFGTRHNSIGALGILGPRSKDAEMAIDAIIKGMNDSNEEARKMAYAGLGGFTNQMEKVVWALLPSLRREEYRTFSLISLKKLGTNAMPVVRAKVTVEGYLPMTFEELEKELANRTGPERE